MARSPAANWFILALVTGSGCFATREESLGELSADAGVEEDAAMLEHDAGPRLDELPLVDAAIAPQTIALDAGAIAIDRDAGHGGDADAAHARDAGRDGRGECREPWEPWECR